jgi:conjugal transfer mating pair stabilization protein TraG
VSNRFKKKVLKLPFRLFAGSARRKQRRLTILVSILALFFTLGVMGMVTERKHQTIIPDTAYSPLLEIIAKGESSGNYNAYYGNSKNKKIKFTEMSISKVMKWQERYLQKGSKSSATGRYQILRSTLAGLVQEHNIDTSKLYDEAMQDHLAIKLMERRGSKAYFEKELSRKQFAANLAKEWAALPKITGNNPHESYYAHDGLNKSRISIAEVYRALARIKV